MTIRGAIARGLISARTRFESTLRTAAAKSSAEFGAGSRILESGNVYNIRKLRSAMRIGEHSLIAGDLLTFAHGGEIFIGDWCYVGAGSRIWSAASIQIGNRVLISHGVNVHDCDSHPKDPLQRHRQFVEIATTGHPGSMGSVTSAPIVIEDDVWIGFNATIMKGVTIGKRSIVAAGTLLTKSVPADSVVIANSVRQIDG
jgi:acetyltransferase-like isoleucine patch superfamily enzyme